MLIADKFSPQSSTRQNLCNRWRPLQRITTEQNVESQLISTIKLMYPRLGSEGRNTQRNSHFVARMCLLECQRNYIYEVSSLWLPKEVQSKRASVNMLAHTWANPWGLNHRQRATGNYRTLRAGKILFLESSTPIGYPVPCSPENLHI